MYLTFSYFHCTFLSKFLVLFVQLWIYFFFPNPGFIYIFALCYCAFVFKDIVI